MKVYKTEKYEIPVENLGDGVFERVPCEERIPPQFKHKISLHYTGRGEVKLIAEGWQLRPPRVGERLMLRADGNSYDLGKIIEIYDVPASSIETNL